MTETMTQIRERHEKLARAMGAKTVKFIPMQDGVDFGCHVDFGDGQGLRPFYPDIDVFPGNAPVPNHLKHLVRMKV